MLMSRFVRTLGALAVLWAVAASAPKPAEANPYSCFIMCTALSAVCMTEHEGDMEYCAGYFAGCNFGCNLPY